MSDKSLRFILVGEDRTASKAIEGVGEAGHKTAGRVGSAFSKMGAAIGGEFGEIVNRIGEGFQQIGEDGGHKLGAKLMVGGAAIGGLGMAFQAMGSTRKAAEEQLKAAIEASGHAYGDYRDDIDKTIKRMENLGHSEGDTQLAMMKITAATNDPKKAIEDMGLVSNLAAAQHESLASAAGQVAKVYGGSGRVLKQYGITMASAKTALADLHAATKAHEGAVTALTATQKKLSDLEAVDASTHKPLSIAQEIALKNAHEAVAKAQEKVHSTTMILNTAQASAKDSTNLTGKALDELGHKLDGQAKAQIDTFSGRIDVIKTKLGDWASMMGGKVGPALTVIGPSIMGVGAILESGLIPMLGTAIAATYGYATSVLAAAGTVAAGFATMIADGAVWAAEMVVDGAMAMLPFLPIILTVAAVGFAAYELYKHWHQVWGDIKDVAVDVWHWAVDIFENKVTQVILAVVAPVLFLALHWRQTWAVIQTIGNDSWHFLDSYLFRPIGAAVGAVGGTLDRMVGFVAGMPSRIAHAAVGMWDGIKDAFRGVINWIIAGWDGLQFGITIPSLHVPGTNMNIGGGSMTFGVPRIPFLKDGGIVPATPGGRLVVVAEGGHDEAIVPLPRGGSPSGAQTIVHVHMGLVYGSAQNAAHEILAALQQLKGQGIQVNLG